MASIAKGVIEFELNLEGEDSYREIRKTVEGRRAEARRDSDPDGALLADSKAATDDAWKELRAAIFATGDALAIDQLHELLVDTLADVNEQLAEQAALDATATEANEVKAA